MTPQQTLDYAEAYMLRGERPRVDLGEVVRVLRERDAEMATVASSAKRELLAEIENLAHRKSHAEFAPTFEVHTADAFRELLRKYTKCPNST